MEKNNSEKKLLYTTYSEAGFVVLELSANQFDKLFQQIHQLSDNFDRDNIGILVKQWMDKAPMYKMSGGWGHRILHGHSLGDASTIYNMHGTEGLTNWFTELGYDFTSKSGLPLPFANELKDSLGLNIHDAVDWLCYNLTDFITASAGIASIVTTFQTDCMPSTLGASSILKITGGVLTQNPILIISGSIALLGSAILLFKGDEIVKNSHMLPGFTEISMTESNYKSIQIEMTDYNEFYNE